MYIWVIYDISNNRSRRWVAKLCKQSGLRNVQKSVFLGKIPQTAIDELVELIKDFVDEDDRLFIVPMNETAFQSMQLFGKSFDEKRIARLSFARVL